MSRSVMRRRTLALGIASLLLLAAPASASALAPVGSGVVGLWQGEGDATDPFNGHDGTLLGGMGFAPASSGQAFSFTEAQQAVDIPDSPALYPSGSFTVAGWVRTTDAVDSQALMGHYECGNFCPTDLANSFFALFVNEGKAEGEIRDADAGGPVSEGTGQVLKGTKALADGADHYLVFQRDSKTEELLLYVDGALEASAPLNEGATGPLENLDGEADDFYLGSYRRCSFEVGCDGSLINQLSGLLDDAIYWERVVSPAEIAAIFAAGPNGLTTDSTAPNSTATAPATAPPGTLSVGFTASDPAGPSPRVHDPSGLSRVDLYVKRPGDSGFAKVASAPGTAAGSFPVAATTPGTYAFETVATDLAGNAEVLPGGPDAVSEVSAAATTPPKATAPKAVPNAPKVADFVTAVFVPPNLYLRLKCPARFKPGCLGTAVAMTAKHGKKMSSSVSAAQKPNHWKLVKLTIKPQFTQGVLALSKRPDKKLLVVRQSIHSRQFEDGRPQTVFHIYRVRSASARLP